MPQFLEVPWNQSWRVGSWQQELPVAGDSGAIHSSWLRFPKVVCSRLGDARVTLRSHVVTPCLSFRICKMGPTDALTFLVAVKE